MFVFGFFVLATPVSAVSVTISNTPSSISDEPFNIDVSITGAQAGNNYLRANLFTSGTIKYFGYTGNGTSFVNSSDYSQYFPVTIDSSGNWSGTIQAKLDPDSNYYTGPGTYSLKVRRYTQSGSSYTWSNEETLNISFSTPSPAPTPIPITPSPSPTSTLSPAPTPKKTIIQTNTPIPSLSPSPKSTLLTSSKNEEKSPAPKPSSKTNPSAKSVAGISVTATSSANPAAEVKSQKKINLPLIIGLLLIVSGTGLSSYIYLRSRNLK